jgi:hypothetical protein
MGGAGPSSLKNQNDGQGVNYVVHGDDLFYTIRFEVELSATSRNWVNVANLTHAPAHAF